MVRVWKIFMEFSLWILQAKWKNAKSVDEAAGQCAAEVGGYPCLIRPSYVLSGAAMKVGDHRSINIIHL